MSISLHSLKDEGVIMASHRPLAKTLDAKDIFKQQIYPPKSTTPTHFIYIFGQTEN